MSVMKLEDTIDELLAYFLCNLPLHKGQNEMPPTHSSMNEFQSLKCPLKIIIKARIHHIVVNRTEGIVKANIYEIGILRQHFSLSSI